MTKIWDFQVPGNNLTFYPYCKVLVEMQFSYFWNSRNRFISKIGSTPGNTQIENIENSAYFWNSTNWKTELIYYINGIPEIGIYVKIVRISGIPKISMSSRFLEFHLLVLLLQFEIVQILGWFVESKVQYCVHFSPLFFPSFSSLSLLYEYNNKLVIGKVGFDVLCFLQLNGMDGLYSLCTLCRYYYYCNTNTALSFRDMHCFSISTIDFSSYFYVCKVFVASKCCILIIIIKFDCI